MNLEGNSSAAKAIANLDAAAAYGPASADGTLQAQVNAGVVQAMLAVAVEVRGLCEMLSQQTVAPEPDTPASEPEVEDLSEKEIDELAARLWEVDSQSPARRFEDDYESTQNKYRKLALAALGLTDGPEEKR